MCYNFIKILTLDIVLAKVEKVSSYETMDENGRSESGICRRYR